MRAKVLTGAATLEQNQGDYEVARTFGEEALLIRRTLNDKPGIAAALTSLGWIAWRQNEYAQARTLSEEAMALHQELGNQPGAIQARNTLAWVAHHQGDFQKAEVLHEECVRLRRQLGDKHRLGKIRRFTKTMAILPCGYAGFVRRMQRYSRERNHRFYVYQKVHRARHCQSSPDASSQSQRLFPEVGRRWHPL